MQASQRDFSQEDVALPVLFLLSVWAVKVNFPNLHAHFHPALLGQSVPFKLSQLFLIYCIREGKWIDLGRWEAGIILCLRSDP